MSWSGHAGGSDAAAQALAARARAGDQAALQQLMIASHPGGWAPDHRGAAIDAWNSLGIGPPLAPQENPHGFLGDVGKGLGSVLKVAAPFAGLIPGVGPLLGAGLAAGGSALGGALHGDQFNLLDTALAGGAGYLGGKWNPFGGAPPGLPGAGGIGNATQGMAGQAPGILSQVGNAGVGSLPGIGDPGMSGNGGVLGSIFGGGGGGLLDKALQYGPLIMGGISGANRQHEADQLMQQGVQGAQQEWQSRAPLRAAAMQQLLALPALQRPDLTDVFADPGNPYARH